jgi:hypothetical protein
LANYGSIRKQRIFYFVGLHVPAPFLSSEVNSRGKDEQGAATAIDFSQIHY